MKIARTLKMSALACLLILMSFSSSTINASAQDFIITTTGDFDNGTYSSTASSSLEYNISAGEFRTSFPWADKDANLSSFYRYEDNFTDETGRRDGTVYDATADGTGGVWSSGCYQFDGTNDFIDLPNNFSFNDYTIAVWVKDDTPIAAEDRPIIGFSNSGSPFDIVQIERVSSLTLRFLPKYTTDSMSSFDRSYTGKDSWYMVAMTVEGTDAKFFADAVQLGATETVNDTEISPTAGSRIGRGSPSFNANDYFTGYIDETKIYNRSLSLSELEDLYNEGKRYIEGYEFGETNVSYPATGSYANRPTAIYNNSLYYFVYLDRENNYSNIKAYNPANSTWSSNYTIASTGGDVHRVPNIAVLPDGKLISFYGSWGSDLTWKISTNTTTEILADFGRLTNWGSANTRAGQYTYPQVVGFSDKIFVMFRVGTAAAGYWAYDTSADGLSWDGETILWVHKTDGCYYPFISKHNSTTILMTASNYTLSAEPQHRKDVYFGYSTDNGTTWREANGTAIAGYFGNETGLIATSSTNTSSSETILDENGYPIVLFGFCDGCSAGATRVRIAQYSAALGSSGSWAISNVTNQDGENVITNDRGNDLNNLFLDDVNGRPTFYVTTDIGSSWNIRRYNRQSGQNSTFDIKYTNDSVSLTMQSQAVKVWDAPDRTFEVFICVKTSTYCTGVAYGYKAPPASWLSGTISMSSGYYLVNLTIVHTVDRASFINRVEILNATTSAILASYDPDIIAGSSTTLTDSETNISDVRDDFKVKLLLSSNSTGTAIITEVSGYFAVINTAPTITTACSYTRLPENTLYSRDFNATDPQGDTLTWSASGAYWATMNSTTGIYSGTSSGGPAQYTVTITVSDGFLSDSCVYIIDVTESSGGKSIHPILVKFNYTKVPLGLRIRFIDKSVSANDQAINKPEKWTWDFGDGTTSNEQDPDKQYEAGGEYLVRLDILDNFGFHFSTSEYIFIPPILSDGHDLPPPEVLNICLLIFLIMLIIGALILYHYRGERRGFWTTTIGLVLVLVGLFGLGVGALLYALLAPVL
jgi:hypothetical protein